MQGNRKDSLPSCATDHADPTYPHAPAAQGILTPIWQVGVALLGLLVLVLGFVAKPVSDKAKVA